MITSEDIIQAVEAYIYKECVKSYNEKVALACTNAVFECLYLNFKGQLMYIPTLNNTQVTKQHEEIYKDFTGANHKDLAIKYNRSLQNIYSIVNNYRDKEIRQRQVDMFPIKNEPKNKPITLSVIEEYLPYEFKKISLSDQDADNLSKKLALFLCQNYPGISICFSEIMRKKRHNKNQLSLF